MPTGEHLTRIWISDARTRSHSQTSANLKPRKSYPHSWDKGQRSVTESPPPEWQPQQHGTTHTHAHSNLVLPPSAGNKPMLALEFFYPSFPESKQTPDAKHKLQRPITALAPGLTCFNCRGWCAAPHHRRVEMVSAKLLPKGTLDFVRYFSAFILTLCFFFPNNKVKIKILKGACVCLPGNVL